MKDKITVVVNGCFDILHPGHIRLLEYAKSLGDYLIVCVNSDQSVKSNKGEHKPYMMCTARMEVLKALRCVDQVIEFDGEIDLAHLYKYLAPDILVLGEEYKYSNITGRPYVKKVVFFPKQIGHSSTLIARAIQGVVIKPMHEER